MTRTRLILHLGLPKTGSTTLQTLLGRNQGVLSAHLRAITPKKWGTRPLRQACARYHNRAFLGEDLTELAEGVRAATREVLDAAPDLAQLIVEAAPEYDVDIMVMTRAYKGWLRSVHNQAIRTDACPLDLEAFAAKAPSGPDAGLHTPVAALIDAMGADRVTVLPMEDDIKGRVGIGSGLLALAEVPDAVVEKLRRPPPLNTSYGPNALEFMRLINAEDVPQRFQRTVRMVVDKNQDLFRD